MKWQCKSCGAVFVDNPTNAPITACPQCFGREFRSPPVETSAWAFFHDAVFKHQWESK